MRKLAYHALSSHWANKNRLMDGEHIIQNERNDESDKIITCSCGKDFPFSVRAQQHYKEMGWPEPIRCRDCRAMKTKRYEERKAETPEKRRERLESSPFHPKNIKGFSQTGRRHASV